MAVQLLLVLFFEAKDYLNGTGVHGGLSNVGTNNARGVFKDVRSDCLAIDGIFSDPFLVAAHLSSTLNADVGVRISFGHTRLRT